MLKCLFYSSRKSDTSSQDCWRGDSSYEFLSSLRTSYQYLMDNNLIESCRVSINQKQL